MKVLRAAVKPDSIERLTERREHQDDAGIDSTEIDPSLISDDGFLPSHPKRYGYFLIVVGILTLVLSVLGVRARVIDWYQMTVTTAFIVFLLLVAYKLIRKEPTQGAGGSEGRPRKLDD